MKFKPLMLVGAIVCAFTFSANAQSRIIQDSILFDYSLAQVDSYFTATLGASIAQMLNPQFGVTAHKVVFKTLKYDSTATYASGLLLIPKSDYCALPIVSYQHGTNVQRYKVPSRFVGDEVKITFALAAGGMIACMPDYHGMGDGEGYHPYQNARTEAFSVIDIIRAAKEICDSENIHYGSQLFLTGYSQGGHATMSAHKMIQEQLSSEMQVTASAPMSGAYDMSGVQTNLMLANAPYSDPYYLPYLLFGNNPIYHIFDSPDSILREPYATTLPPVMDGLHSESQINSLMNDTVKLIFRPDVLASFETDTNYYLHAILHDNDVYQWVPQSPVRMYFCTQDEKVPYENTYVAYAYFKGHGALTAIDTINTGPMMHTACAQPSLINAKVWMDGMRNQPMNVSVSSQLPPGESNGSVTLDITGGKAPIHILWNNGDTTNTLNGLALGDTYSYTVTDSFGCVKTGTVTFGVSGITDLSKDNIRVYPNPANDVITVEKTAKSTQFSILQMFNMLGQKVLETILQKDKQTVDVSALSQGVYLCKIDHSFTQLLLKN